DGQGSYAMPPALDQLDVGFHEVFEGDLSFRALVRDIDGRRFVLLQDQSDFEAREQVLYASVLTGYVLSIALAVADEEAHAGIEHRVASLGQ
ncbi:hypothetical protein ACV34J_31770, partial [Pseudomonas aeruginosa]